MAKINANSDLRVVRHSKLVTEITTIYNNKFIRRVYVGMPYKKAIDQFEKKKGTL